MGLAGDRGVAPPRRSTPGSPSLSRLALASLPQPELEVRSLRNAARQYPCARPFVLSPRAARGLDPRRTGNDEWFRNAGLSFRYSSPNPAVPVALLPIPLRTGCTVPPALHGRACPPLHSSAALLPACCAPAPEP